jgi:uncharacterized membrane protein YeaQ/YmgE (transglycosylase-associated protein family)
VEHIGAIEQVPAPACYVPGTTVGVYRQSCGLGIVGAIVASYLGQALGWYAPGEGAGLIGAVLGAIVVLFVWGVIAKRRA